MVYVPYDAAKQGTGDFADRTVENPIADSSKKGTVETVSYTGADGTQHGLAVYLPAGYDKDRAEPYKVLYLSHGTSGDIYGDELRWMNEGAVANIMDNLIAEGKAEAFVVVTMNNQQFGQGDGHSGPNWKYTDIADDQINYIMPYVESNYNVADTAEGRAYAGLSMGGSTTSNMLMYHPDLFNYYGIWSYANTDASYGDVAGIEDAEVQASLSALTTKPNIMLAAGQWDFGRAPVLSFGETLAELGMESSYLEVPAAHDWENWQLVYAYAAENFFFKPESSSNSTDVFTDVNADGWYASAVNYCYDKGLMSGVSETSFEPDTTVSRAMLVQVLYSLENSPAVDLVSFTDVSDGQWYANAASWAFSNGIISGYTNGRFGPNNPVTREQVALILYQYVTSKGYDNSKSADTAAFQDNGQISSWAADSVKWAVGSGLISGKGDNILDPQGTATRAEIATILMNFCENIAK
jgi:enterochelin esterase-like enzyme